jgi:DNA mismatch repair protein MutS2
MTLFYDHLPTLDLHGFDRDYARIQIEEFIEDQYKCKKKEIVIIHGNGTGVLRKTTQEVLKRNKYVKEYKIHNYNTGMTIITLKNV